MHNRVHEIRCGLYGGLLKGAVPGTGQYQNPLHLRRTIHGAQSHCVGADPTACESPRRTRSTAYISTTRTGS